MRKMFFPRVNEGGGFKYSMYSAPNPSDEQQSIEIVFIEKFSHDNFGIQIQTF